MSTAKTKSIILYSDQLSLIRGYSFEQLGHLLSALIRNIDGEDTKVIERTLQEPVLTAYRFIALQLKIDKEKYQQTCEKRKSSANKRWHKKGKDANAFFAMHNDNENENENEKENENENENEKKEEINSSSSSSNNDSDGVAEEEDEEEKILKFSKKGALGWMSWFKELVETNESRISPPKIMTFERARGLYQLIKKFGRETVANVFRRAVQTSFLNGKGKNKFVASFDWLLEEKNFVNVYEGNFFC